MSSIGAAISGAPRDQASRLRAMMGAVTDDQQTVAPEHAPSKPAPHVTPIVTIASGKGGVGKTTTAVNVAAALAARGVRATLVDADLGMANADVLCGLAPTRRLERTLGLREHDGSLARAEPLTMRDLSVEAPGGFRLVPGTVGAETMAELDESDRSALVRAIDAVERDSDIVLIDTSAGLGGHVASFLGAADLGLVVVAPEPTSVADAYALIKSTRKRSVGVRLALVVNQVGGRREAERVHERIAGVCERFLGFRPSLAGYIARDPRVPASVRDRRPVVLSHPKSRSSVRYEALARRLRDELALRAGGASASQPAGGLRSRLGRGKARDLCAIRAT